MSRQNALTICATCASLFLILLTPRVIVGQATTGGIIGTVTDQSGAAVPGASVAIRNLDQNTTSKVESNESGNYSQGQLIPGSYEVTIQRTGFKAAVQRNVSVIVGVTVRVDQQLQIGEKTQQVTVTEAPPGLETSNAQVTSKLSGQQMDQLPVINRNFTNLNLLAPGATLNTFQHAASENPQQSTLVNTNGQEFAGTNYMLDGILPIDVTKFLGGHYRFDNPARSWSSGNKSTKMYTGWWSYAATGVRLRLDSPGVPGVISSRS